MWVEQRSTHTHPIGYCACFFYLSFFNILCETAFFFKAFVYLYYLTSKGYVLLLMRLLTPLRATTNGLFFFYACCDHYTLHTRCCKLCKKSNWRNITLFVSVKNKIESQDLSVVPEIIVVRLQLLHVFEIKYYKMGIEGTCFLRTVLEDGVWLCSSDHFPNTKCESSQSEPANKLISFQVI